ncbi:MAG: TIGR01212 family radical SAM protein [bacterium]|nr:TIGR01212 family radical SAM protein [bacterium]
MKNFKYTLDNKRYHTLNYEYKTTYGKKVFKVSLNAGFSCPNKKNGFGCIFCSPLGSGDFAGDKSEDLITQFEMVKQIMSKKWPDAYYIGYFQANTNTYAPVSILKEKFEPILKLPNVIGLSIATRSDCINDECLNYLIDLNRRTNLTIELGLQSMHDETLRMINRGHDLKNFDDCVKKLVKNNIKVVVHIINGLPGETKDMMIKTAQYVNSLNVWGIKIHMLHIIKNTKLAEIYEEKPFHILSKDEYIDIVVNQLEYLKPTMIIHRLTGDPKKEDLIAPNWVLKKFVVLNDIDKEMVKRDTYQGNKIK